MLHEGKDWAVTFRWSVFSLLWLSLGSWLCCSRSQRQVGMPLTWPWPCPPAAPRLPSCVEHWLGSGGAQRAPSTRRTDELIPRDVFHWDCFQWRCQPITRWVSECIYASVPTSSLHFLLSSSLLPWLTFYKLRHAQSDLWRRLCRQINPVAWLDLSGLLLQHLWLKSTLTSPAPPSFTLILLFDYLYVEFSSVSSDFLGTSLTLWWKLTSCCSLWQILQIVVCSHFLCTSLNP